MQSIKYLYLNYSDFFNFAKVMEWILDTKQAAFLSSSTDFHKISSFVQKIGTNPSVRDKTARFSVPSPFQYVATRQRFLPAPAPAARASSALCEREVTWCGVS